MKEFEELADAIAQLKRALWNGRWPLAVYLGLVWLACVAFLAWQTWMSA